MEPVVLIFYLVSFSATNAHSEFQGLERDNKVWENDISFQGTIKNFMARENRTEKAMYILEEKSAKARAIVKQSILEKQIGIGKVDKAIVGYLSSWNDTTRPGVLALASEAVNGKREAVPLQVALLFIDATMDIHDDLIDESVVKKNRKTVYGKLGKEATLLIGDMFMVKGFHYLNKAIDNLPVEQRSMIMDGIQDFLSEVVEAHVSEVPLKTKRFKVRPETYFQILQKKAADIEGRMKVGAIYGGGSAKQIEALSNYGRNIGVLLAVRSDFVDIFEPSELMHRIKHEVLPLPILYALRSHKHGRKIREILKRDCLGNEDCRELVDIVYETKEFAFLKMHLRDLEKEAENATEIISNEKVKKQLQLLAASMLEDL
jgi:geranylgeranyl pyrophosphate synthase